MFYPLLGRNAEGYPRQVGHIHLGNNKKHIVSQTGARPQPQNHIVDYIRVTR